MAEFAKVVRVTRRGLEIDGKEFPWYFAEGVDIHMSKTDLPGVTLTLIAKQIVVDDDAVQRKT